MNTCARSGASLTQRAGSLRPHFAQIANLYALWTSGPCSAPRYRRQTPLYVTCAPTMMTAHSSDSLLMHPPHRYIAALQAKGQPMSLNKCWTTATACFFSCGGYAGGKCGTNDGAALGINPMGNETCVQATPWRHGVASGETEGEGEESGGNRRGKGKGKGKGKGMHSPALPHM